MHKNSWRRKIFSEFLSSEKIDYEKKCGVHSLYQKIFTRTTISQKLNKIL